MRARHLSRSQVRRMRRYGVEPMMMIDAEHAVRAACRDAHLLVGCGGDVRTGPAGDLRVDRARRVPSCTSPVRNGLNPIMVGTGVARRPARDVRRAALAARQRTRLRGSHRRWRTVAGSPSPPRRARSHATDADTPRSGNSGPRAASWGSTRRRRTRGAVERTLAAWPEISARHRPHGLPRAIGVRRPVGLPRPHRPRPRPDRGTRHGTHPRDRVALGTPPWCRARPTDP